MLMEKGVRPCWVFDGKPPEAKKKLLGERKKRKDEAEINKNEALEEGDMEKVLKYASMSVKITSQMISDAKELIRLLGLPLVEAPSEAEAQCSIMAKAGKVFAVATEDMDCLTFGCPIQLRDFTNKDDPVIEIKLDAILKGLGVTMDQFIDICILSGCDYCDNIDGIGSIKALKLISENKDIEGVIEYVEKYNSDPKKKKKLIYDPESFNFEEARKLFKNPEVTDPETIDLKWGTPDYEGLKKFLVDGKGFMSNRIESAMKRIEVNNII
jgi:flap endonuclease-1